MDHKALSTIGLSFEKHNGWAVTSCIYIIIREVPGVRGGRPRLNETQ